MPTFDGDNLIMTLDAPVAGVLSLDTETDWYSEWKKWTLLDDNMRYEDAFELIISEELTPGIESGAYFFFRNNVGWRVRPYEADATIYLNGNLVPRDSALPIMIPTIGAYTVLIAGLQPVTQNIDTIAQSLNITRYLRHVGIHVDSIDGNDANDGTRLDPVKTENGLHVIYNQYEFRDVYVMNPLTITADHSTMGHKWIGDKPDKVAVTLDPACNVTNNDFEYVYLSGKLNSGNVIRECIVGSITNANNYIYESALLGPIVISDNLTIEDCWIAPTAPSQECVIDFNSLAKTVIIGDWSTGRIVAKNMVAGSFIGMSGTGGRLVIDSTCAGGTAVYGGSILIDNTLGGTLDSLKNSSVAGAVWLQDMTEDYPVDGQSSMTPAQAHYATVQLLTEFVRSGALISVKKRDGVTQAIELTLDSATAPTQSTQTG